MADLSHKHSSPRKRTIERRSLSSRVALPVAGVLTVAAAATAAVMHGGSPIETPTVPDTELFAASASLGQPPTEVSRSAERPPVPNVAAVEEQIEGLRYATETLEIHADAKTSSPVLAEVAYGDTVDITGQTQGRWTQIMHNDLPRWVKASGIAKEMPLGTAPCASGSGAERGLRPDTIKVHRAVCAKFPSITNYGGVAGRGEHATGQALDIMVSSDVGSDIAAFLMENRAELGIEYIIWRQRIWRPSTSSAWRGMSDRGGATANHMDHVHVTTYGSSATR